MGYGYKNMTSSVAGGQAILLLLFFVFHLFSVERSTKCGQTMSAIKNFNLQLITAFFE